MKKRFLFGALAVLLALITIMPAAFMEGASQVVSDTQVKLSEEEAAALLETLELAELALPEGDTFRITVSPDDLSVQEGLNPDWQHILLMGTDTGSKVLNYGRTDTMIIASINEKTKQLKLTSLVRDMLVDIPGLNNQNRINTANRFGGPLLAMKVVNEVMGLNITRYVSINFSGFSTLIDTLGGVEIALSAAEASELKMLHVDEPQLLNGEKALEYVRIRKLDNNFGRNERQRILLESLFRQATSLGMNEIISLIPPIVELVSTNLSTSDIIGLLPILLSVADGPDMMGLPQAGAFNYYQTDTGASVVVFDQEAVRREFFAFIDNGSKAQ